MRAADLIVLASSSTNGSVTQKSNGESQPSESESDLVSDVGTEIKVTLDRWSVGQLGVSDLIAAAVVIAAGVALAWAATRFIRHSTRNATGGARAAVRTIEKLVAAAIYLFATALALEIIGFSFGPLLIVLFVVVVAILVLRPMITNLSSGFLLQLRGALAIGDLVSTAGGVFGVVREISARTTVIDTSDGQRVHVPNSDVLNDVIVNYTSIGQRRSSFDIMVDHDQDLDAVVSTIRSAIARVDEVQSDPEPQVEVTKVVGRLIVIRARFWHPPSQQASRVTIDRAIRATVADLHAAGIALEGPDLVEVGADRSSSC